MSFSTGRLRFPAAVAVCLLASGILGAQVVRDLADGIADAELLGMEQNLAGTSLAIGDLDGDTRPDLALGLPGATGPAMDRPGAGAVAVFFDAGALAGTQDILNVADFILWGEEGSGISPEFGDNLGLSLLVRDLDGDTNMDLAAGAPGATGVSGRGSSGEVVVLYGPLTAGSLDLASASPDLLIEGAGTGDALGLAMAAGEVNGLAGLEMLLAAPAADGESDSRPDAGEIYVLDMGGRPMGDLDLSSASVYGLLRGEASNDLLGSSVALGDLLGDDGLEDLVLGAAGADGPLDSRQDAGGVYVVDATFIPPIPIEVIPDVLLHGGRAGDRAGRSLTVLDWDLDGSLDLAVGAPGGDGPTPFNRVGAGQVHLVYFDGTDADPVRDLSTYPIQTRIFGAMAGHELAAALSDDRLLADPASILLAAAPRTDGPNGTRLGAGSVALFFPETSRPPFVDLLVSDPDVVIHGARRDDALRTALLADVCSGFDLVTAAPPAEVDPDMARAGRAYLLCALVPNNPPVAVAGVPVRAGCAVGGQAMVPLDGSLSTDADSSGDTNDDIVQFDWYEGSVAPANLIATGETTSASLAVGSHDIILVVTDSQGTTDQDMATVVVEDNPDEVLDLRVRRPPPGADLVLTWTASNCADTHRVFRGTLAALPAWDHATPFTSDPGEPECRAATGVALTEEGASSGAGRQGFYYLVAGVADPDGARLIGSLGGADTDANGSGDLARPRPGEDPGVQDACP